MRQGSSRPTSTSFNTPIVSDEELSDASHASRDLSEGARAREEQQQEIDEKRPQRLRPGSCCVGC